jgi:hypothetical protein
MMTFQAFWYETSLFAKQLSAAVKIIYPLFYTNDPACFPLNNATFELSAAGK